MKTVARETGWYQMSKVINPNEHVLIVEDDDRIRRLLARYLTKSGLSVDGCADKRGLDQKLLARTPDCILLDLRLPDANGLDIARDLRETYPGIGIIILTGASDSVDKIVGLEIGADDYLVKPFEIQELEARVRVLIKRGHASPSTTDSLQVGGIEFDQQSLVVTRDGQELVLSPIGFKLLKILMERSPSVVSRQDIEREIWGDMLPDSDTLRSHMYNLRKVIDKPFNSAYLQTLPGIGYRFCEPDAAH